ncbi:MAG: XdhC family protein [Solidesulfovibrio sp.]|uniref:XdhC family protein n=1 Tax=Solidesulfovibrio sp. TaxID=2910990 RepID=UPI0031592449
MSNIFHDNMTVAPAVAMRTVNDCLGRGQAIVVATIVPVAKPGALAATAKLLVDRGGRIVGETEGGGLERRVLAEAAQVWATGLPRLLDCSGLGSVADREAGLAGSIERIFVERLAPEARTVTLFRLLGERLAKGLPSLLVSPAGVGDGAGGQGATRCLLGPQGVLAGHLPTAAGVAQALRLGGEATAPVAGTLEGQAYFLEPVLPRDPVYILGAGRVGRLVARLAALAGFRVVILDDDPGYASPERFSQADEVVVLDDFQDCFAGRSLGAEASVVVMTRGHAHDTAVLAQALGTGAGYIGMMGCKADGLARVAQVGQGGFAPDDVARVHCPIGLPIGGATPEETALSVVAQLVLARSQRLGRVRG